MAFSAHKLLAPEYKTSRMRMGASAAPRMNDEFSSEGTPTMMTEPGVRSWMDPRRLFMT